jgi:hypothetical protein
MCCHGYWKKREGLAGLSLKRITGYEYAVLVTHADYRILLPYLTPMESANCRF